MESNNKLISEQETIEENKNNIDGFSFSFEESANLVGVSQEVFIRIFTKYVNALGDKVNDLENKIKDNNFEEIASVAHALKGSSGNMNVTKLYDFFRFIELSSKEKKNNTYEIEILEIRKIIILLKKLI